MDDLADMELLRRYAEEHSQEAFAALVSRYVNLVYSVALRKTGNAHAAEEISQAVFIILARKARNLAGGTILSGWLYQTARLTAANFLRTEIRRAQREQEAYMQSLSEEQEPNLWPQIASHLDDAMGQLGEKDRNAITLRFLEGKSFQEVARAFGDSENAAKKRVHRALEKLRVYFVRRGIASTTAILAGVISAHSVQAAPASLAATISAAAVTQGAAAGAPTLTLVKGALKIMAWSKMKTAVVTGAALLLAAGTTTVVVEKFYRLEPKPVAATQMDFPKSAWAFAGYSNPRSAFLSALWARSQGNFKVYLQSLTPEQAQREREDILRQMNWGHKSEKEVIAAIAQHDFARTSGFRVLDETSAASDQTILHAFIQGENQNVTAKFQKIGQEWKFAGFDRPARPQTPQSR